MFSLYVEPSYGNQKMFLFRIIFPFSGVQVPFLKNVYTALKNSTALRAPVNKAYCCWIRFEHFTVSNMGLHIIDQQHLYNLHFVGYIEWINHYDCGIKNLFHLYLIKCHVLQDYEVHPIFDERAVTYRQRNLYETSFTALKEGQPGFLIFTYQEKSGCSIQGGDWESWMWKQY